MKKKITKHQLVKNHLIEKGTITSWEAINNYAATRLSAIIFNLKKEGFEFSTETISTKDKFKNVCHYAKYTLIKKPKKHPRLFND